jgi:hypothetical protein
VDTVRYTVRSPLSARIVRHLVRRGRRLEPLYVIYATRPHEQRRVIPVTIRAIRFSLSPVSLVIAARHSISDVS